MANRYAAGAAGLPFAVLRGYRGTDLVAHTATLAPIVCPFTGEELTAVPAINPDVSIIHAQQADTAGNVMLWGITGVQKEALLAARRALVTVEEIVDVLEPRPGAIVIPSWAVSHVAAVPGGVAPELRPGLLDPRQRLLPRVGRDLVRPPALHRVAGGATSSVPRRVKP